MKLVDVDLLKGIIYEMWGGDPAYHTAVGIGEFKTETDAKAEEACLILENIDALPPFEIVQCKDCKYRGDIDEFKGVTYYECTQFSYYDRVHFMLGTDYCSLGERKVNDQHVAD